MRKREGLSHFVQTALSRARERETLKLRGTKAISLITNGAPMTRGGQGCFNESFIRRNAADNQCYFPRRDDANSFLILHRATRCVRLNICTFDAQSDRNAISFQSRRSASTVVLAFTPHLLEILPSYFPKNSLRTSIFIIDRRPHALLDVLDVASISSFDVK